MFSDNYSSVVVASGRCSRSASVCGPAVIKGVWWKSVILVGLQCEGGRSSPGMQSLVACGLHNSRSFSVVWSEGSSPEASALRFVVSSLFPK